MKKLKPLEKLAFTFEPSESVPKPGIAEKVVGRKRIGEMTPDEYLKLATAAQRAVAEGAPRGIVRAAG